MHLANEPQKNLFRNVLKSDNFLAYLSVYNLHKDEDY